MSWKPPEDEDSVVVTWEYDGRGRRNRMHSQPMSEKEARRVAKLKREEDEAIHTAVTKKKNLGLFGW